MALGLGCTVVTGDFSDIVAILYTGPASPQVAEGDTLTLTAVALDASGQPLPDTVTWRIMELDTVEVGFTLDSLTGLVTGVLSGSWRVQGSVETLRTNLITVTVTAAPDSIAAVEPSRITFEAGTAESPSLVATVFDVRPDGTSTPLGGHTVRFQVIEPAAGTPGAAEVAIGAPGETPGTDPLVATVTSGTNGQAAVTARRLGVTPPDSAVVEAVVLTTSGSVLPGTPARFVVIFETN